MPTAMETLVEGLREARDRIEAEIADRRAAFRYRVERRRVIFEDGMLARHRAMRESLRSFLGRTRPLTVLTAPVVYAMIVPFALMDACVTLYQAICFRAYGIDRARRADYIFLDRHQLAYLNALQKLNCVYCGYANGVAAFTREVAARTEAYWCPIKHSRRLRDPHDHYPGFLDYGDAEGFRARIEADIRRHTPDDQP